MITRKIVLLGAGGHAKVIADILFQQGVNLEAVVCPEDIDVIFFRGAKHLRSNSDIFAYSTDEVLLVNGIGSIPGKQIRSVLFNSFKKHGYFFKSVISSHAIVSEHATLGEGVQILSGAIVQVGASIGSNCIINTGAILEHGCLVGDDCHVAPGAVLCGNVIIGTKVHVGTGANIIQSVAVGDFAVIGAGSTVTKDVESYKVTFPARITIK